CAAMWITTSGRCAANARSSDARSRTSASSDDVTSLTFASSNSEGSVGGARATAPGSLPFLPGRGARRPQLLEVALVAQRVHRVPEAVVAVGRELPLGGEALHRLALPHRVIAVDVAADLGGQHEEAAVDPAAVAVRLLLEAAHALVLHLQGAEAPGRLHGRDRRERVLGAVEVDQLPDVDRGQAVA